MFRTVALSTCVLGLVASPAAVAGQADLILVGTRVITADPKQPTAEAIALAGERIRAVGATDDIRRLVGPHTRVVDLHVPEDLTYLLRELDHEVVRLRDVLLPEATDPAVL